MNGVAPDRKTINMAAQALGWLSLGLGIFQLAAPHTLARWLGLREGEPLLRSYGVREMTSGVGLLTSQNPRPWMIARTGGDAIDIATLLTTFRRNNDKNMNVALALLAVLGVTVVDSILTDRLCREKVQAVRRRRQATRDYSRRSGFRKPPGEMRGAARDFKMPEDFRTPRALEPLAG